MYIIIYIVAEVVDELSAVVGVFREEGSELIGFFSFEPVLLSRLAVVLEEFGHIFDFPTEVLDESVADAALPRLL